MGALSALDWAAMFDLNVPALELVMRGSVMYWFLFLVFRFVVRRDVGSIGIADILLLVIVADASQNAMAGTYDSVTEGILLVSTLIFWNVLLDWAAYRFPLVRRWVEPPVLYLVRNGSIQRRNLRREFISEDELWAKLRQNGIEALSQVKSAYLEADGEISVIRRG